MTRKLGGLVCDHCRLFEFASHAVGGAFSTWVIESKNVSPTNNPNSEQVSERHFCSRKCADEFNGKDDMIG